MDKIHYLYGYKDYYNNLLADIASIRNEEERQKKLEKNLTKLTSYKIMHDAFDARPSTEALIEPNGAPLLLALGKYLISNEPEEKAARLKDILEQLTINTARYWLDTITNDLQRKVDYYDALEAEEQIYG